MSTRTEHRPVDEDLVQRLREEKKLVQWPRPHTQALALRLAALLLHAPAWRQGY